MGPKREETQMEYLQQMLKDIDHSKRKDLVCMASLIVDAPASLSEEFHDRFFDLSYNFLVDRYGGIAGFKNKEDVVISCYRHRDESTDHIHFAFCPILNEDDHQRFCAKEVISREDLRTLHQDLDRYLKENGLRCEILNGKTQRDSTGRALSVREMKYRDAHQIERESRGRF